MSGAGFGSKVNTPIPGQRILSLQVVNRPNEAMSAFRASHIRGQPTAVACSEGFMTPKSTEMTRRSSATAAVRIIMNTVRDETPFTSAIAIFFPKYSLFF